MKTVYLAGPINGKTDEECRTWREQAKTGLSPQYRVLDPMRRDYRGNEHDHARKIVEGDIYDIGASDIVLANCTTPSWGTAMELRVAYDAHKTILVICEKASASPWLRYHATAMFPSLLDAVQYLNRFHNGE